ncbi:MAG: YggS family pyridoxal phosphate-dependent enzyme [Chloroflexi bacterium]|nr:YggS family pyridoxal phosphate-dependent enzyme [Chloroflexota bacterium]MBU1750175.1 YggS family pyridoxal phosphate-dependent enzyme [Chloroflexota bacterium]MBU1880117.1 YggS family pyridoxal phosphate-dependent enzyme [Chloroflexota bacterium]
MNTDLATNLERVHARITAAAARAGRDPTDVLLVPVTKTVSDEVVRAAYALGLRVFGENRVQEAQAKAVALADLPDVHWHLVGHLQRNKAKTAADLFALIQSIDSVRLAQALSQRATEAGRTVPVLLEVNVAGESTKYGLELAQVRQVAPDIMALPGLAIQGLMTVAPLTDDPEVVRPVFRQLRDLRDELRAAHEQPPHTWHHLSMGMTDDFAVAIEEGATMVRIGRAIFGERF